MLQVDRLYEAVAEKSPVCVGLDTDFSYIPAECVDKTLSKGENIFRRKLMRLMRWVRK